MLETMQKNSCVPSDPKLGADNSKIDMSSNYKCIHYAEMSVRFIAVQMLTLLTLSS